MISMVIIYNDIGQNIEWRMEYCIGKNEIKCHYMTLQQ